RRARRCLWLAALELSDPATALAAAGAAVRTDELDEEAHRAVMLAHYRAGDQGAALAAFERLRTILEDQLGTDPGPETEALHVAILRNEEPAPASRPSPETRADVMDPGFVGRDREVDMLLKRWSRASGGSAGLVLITGEAGIGKSRLAAEAARIVEATGGVVLRSRCYQAERSLFLQPIAEALRWAVTTLSPDDTRAAAGEWAGPLAELAPEVSRVVAPVDYEPGPPQVERRRTFEAVASFFHTLSQRRPVLLVLDDLHLAGAATIELLHFMVRRIGRARVLVIATMRSEEASDVVGQVVEIGDAVALEPLREEAVASLARQAKATALATDLMRKTAGHTLFVVEALRAIVESGEARTIPIPDSLRHAVVARTKRLGAETEGFLRAVVGLGSTFDVGVAAELAGVPLQEAVVHAERALHARLIVQSGSAYGFANDLIREILYDSTPRPSRVARHRLAATLLADNPEASAVHLAAAGDVRGAAEAWLTAAESAAASFANRDAARLLGEAVTAAHRSGADLLAARCRLTRSRVRETLGEYREASEDASAALEIAQRRRDPDLEAQALERLAWVAYSSRYDEGADDLARRAWEFSESAAEASGARPSATVLRARLKHSRGEVHDASEVLQDAVAGDLDDATRAAALSCLGSALAHGDRFEEAARTLERAVELCRKTKNLRFLVNGLFFSGMAQGNLGRFGPALSTFDTLARLVEESESRSYRARVANLRSWMYRELGDVGRARDLAQEAVDRAAEFGEVEPRGHAALALAECALLEGDDAEAARLVDEVSAMVAGRVVGFSWRLELHAAELRARVEAERAEAVLELARRCGSRKYEALAFAHLGRPRDALRIATALGSDYLTALVGDEESARRAVDRLALGLPEDLREGFVARGPLSAAGSSAARRDRAPRSSRRPRA
ncbi:MAG: AAA family ATPase, partial [Actinomycetota bacterium]|nr:AAA family ATPase [Actinomycetota bacterium]